MSIHYFAHYLLNKGILTSSQMNGALEYERSVRVRLGIIAINAGFMTARQVEEVHELQRSKDKHFGALAVEQGYLTNEQLAVLLTAQGSKNFTFIQAIADKGYLTLGELEKIIANYRSENEISEQEWTSQDAVDSDELIRALYDFSAMGDNAEIFYNYVGLLYRNLVRFLNDNPVILGVKPWECDKANYWQVSQNIVGDINLSTNIIMEDVVLLELARRFYGGKLTEIDELALDSAAEFLNVHNGVFSGNLSNDGVEANLLPQQIQKYNGESSNMTYRISIGLSFGRIDLMLSSEDE
ncbi:MAG TPA: hypothetical protein VGL27_06455 [Negativicutes bacterium]